MSGTALVAVAALIVSAARTPAGGVFAGQAEEDAAQAEHLRERSRKARETAARGTGRARLAIGKPRQFRLVIPGSRPT